MNAHEERRAARTIVITGATGGIGRATARALAAKGHRLLLVGRSPERLERTIAELNRVPGGRGDVEGMQADLSLMGDVARLADRLKERLDRLDVLINNAGAFILRRRVTAEGFPYTFALNHLAYFHLTLRLLELLKASSPARVINVASGAHRDAPCLADPVTGAGLLRGWKAYAYSKLCNLQFTFELARRLEPGGVTANALHPGFVATGIGVNHNPLLRPVMWLVSRRARTVEQGADTVVWLAHSDEVAGITGGYFEDRRSIEPTPAARDRQAAGALWRRSVEVMEPFFKK